METEILSHMHTAHKKWEGDRLAAYSDPLGILTIGRGHNCEADPVPGIVKVGDRIDEDELENLYEADCRKAFADLDRHLPWWRELSPPRAAALFDMCFNMGIGRPSTPGKPARGLRSFVNTLRHVREGSWAAAAQGMMASKWARQVGDGYGGRLDRAEAMAIQMETGQWAI